jgi:hypothetical protein
MADNPPWQDQRQPQADVAENWHINKKPAATRDVTKLPAAGAPQANSMKTRKYRREEPDNVAGSPHTPILLVFDLLRFRPPQFSL